MVGNTRSISGGVDEESPVSDIWVSVAGNIGVIVGMSRCGMRMSGVAADVRMRGVGMRNIRMGNMRMRGIVMRGIGG
jgi:hypothetical protein